ncbi:hypothetical protein FQR65_LT06135, partial [Abscondita terminalis]
MPAEDIRTIRVLVEVLVVCFPALLICNAGENMANESQKVAEVAYEIDFIGTDVGFQKCLIMIMRQAQTSATIKAGKFFDVSLLSYTM